MNPQKKVCVTTKLSGEEYLLFQDFALRQGKSLYQLMYDILVERLNAEFGVIDYCIPCKPEPRGWRRWHKPRRSAKQLTFTFLQT